MFSVESTAEESYERTTFGAVCDLVNGKAFKPSDWSTGGVPIVRIQNLNDPDAEYHWEFYYDHSTIDHDKLSGMKQLLRNTYYEIYITEE